MKTTPFRLLSFAVISFIIVAGCAQSPDQLKKSLFDAVKSGQSSIVKECIANNANLNDPETPGGWSVLHYAARSGNDQIVKMLIDAGANPNYVGTAPGQSGTIMSLKPKVVAQASLHLAKTAQDNPLFHLDDPQHEKKLRDPAALAGYERVCKLLEAVTQD